MFLVVYFHQAVFWARGCTDLVIMNVFSFLGPHEETGPSATVQKLCRPLWPEKVKWFSKLPRVFLCTFACYRSPQRADTQSSNVDQRDAIDCFIIWGSHHLTLLRHVRTQTRLKYGKKKVNPGHKNHIATANKWSENKTLRILNRCTRKRWTVNKISDCQMRPPPPGKEPPV